MNFTVIYAGAAASLALALIDTPNAVAERVFEEKIAWQTKRQPEDYRQFSEQFVQTFNSENMDYLGEMISPSLLAKRPLEKMASFLAFLKSNNGEIKHLRFKYFDREQQRDGRDELAVYSLTFANGSQWAFRTKIDEFGLMTRFIITDPNYNEDLPLRSARSKLSLPFVKGDDWYVLWGGEAENQNYHVTSRAQKNAFDFIVRNPWSKKSYRTNGSTNEDYYAFGKPVLSPADGIVVTAVDGISDNEPGEMNSEQLTGNTVVIRTKANEYVLLAHLQNQSIFVEEGQQIKQGQQIGLCGNSGNSSEPHLHLHVMDRPTLKESQGLKAHFDEVIVNESSVAMHYSPTRGDIVASH